MAPYFPSKPPTFCKKVFPRRTGSHSFLSAEIARHFFLVSRSVWIGQHQTERRLVARLVRRRNRFLSPDADRERIQRHAAQLISRCAVDDDAVRLADCGVPAVFPAFPVQTHLSVRVFLQREAVAAAHRHMTVRKEQPTALTILFPGACRTPCRTCRCFPPRRGSATFPPGACRTPCRICRRFPPRRSSATFRPYLLSLSCCRYSA